MGKHDTYSRFVTSEMLRQTLGDEGFIQALPRMPREFFARNALDVAPDLLGLILAHKTPEGTTAGLITEVEAYAGPEDRACHAYGWRRTRRNEVMYGPPGFAYVYFTYGMYYCFNVVVASEGIPHAVLVRSLEPVFGMDLMLKRRKGRLPLTEGPGRMCQAMGIGREQNGKDLLGEELFIARPPEELDISFEILTTPRIGIDYAGEAREYPWRFVARLRGPRAQSQSAEDPRLPPVEVN